MTSAFQNQGNAGSTTGPFAPPPPPPPTPSQSTPSVMHGQHRLNHPTARHVFSQASSSAADSSVESTGEGRMSCRDRDPADSSTSAPRPQTIVRGNSDLGLRLASRKKVSLRHSLESSSDRRCGSAGSARLNPLTTRSLAGSETQLFRPRVYNTTQGLVRTTPAVHLISSVESTGHQGTHNDQNGSKNRSLPKAIPSSFTSFSTVGERRRLPGQTSSLSSIPQAVESEESASDCPTAGLPLDSDSEKVQVFVTSPVDDGTSLRRNLPADHSTIFEDKVLVHASSVSPPLPDMNQISTSSNSSSSDVRSPSGRSRVTPLSSTSRDEESDEEEEESVQSVIERQSLIKSPSSPDSPSLHPQYLHHPHHQHHHPHFRHHHNRSDH